MEAVAHACLVFKQCVCVCRMTERLLHFKVVYDAAFEPAEIAQSLFGTAKCMVQIEKINSNTHYHVQGYTSVPEKDVRHMLTLISKKHQAVKLWNEGVKRWLDEHPKPDFGEKEWKEEMKKACGGCPRPCKKADDYDLTEKGFQYMMKEGRDPVFSQGFTREELDGLKKASDEHVDKLKNGLKEHLHAILDYPKTPERAFKKMRLDAYDYYKKEDKRPRPMFQKDVLWTMAHHPQHTDEWKEFIVERL